MDDEERERRKQRALAESKRILRRTDPEPRRDEASPLPPRELAETLIGTAPPDRVAMWKARADRHTAQREAVKAELAAMKQQQQQPFDWSAFDQRIDAAIGRERTLMAEALGEETAKLLDEERKETMRLARQQTREIKSEIATLRAETVELRARLAELRAEASVTERALRDDLHGCVSGITETLSDFAAERRKAAEEAERKAAKQKAEQVVIDLPPMFN
jgi:hypothetical protein